jgi:ABC-type cobalt transport system, permease component CbiQ and related transporters
MSPGVFYPGNSLLHRLQARTKLLVIGMFVVVLLIANQRQWHFAPYIFAIGLMLCGMICSGIPLRELGRRLALLFIVVFSSLLLSIFGGSNNGPVVWQCGPWSSRGATLSYALLFIAVACGILLLVSFLTLPFTEYLRRSWVRGLLLLLLLLSLLLAGLAWVLIPQRLLPIGPLVITQQSVWILVISFVVFMVLYTLSMLLTMTTNPVALIEGLTLLFSPLRRLALPVDDFALMALLALRFIPTLMDEAEQLMKAQSARGADLLHGTWRERMQSFSSLFVALVQGTLRRASELATALEARGYRSQGTLLYEQPLGSLDYFVLIVVGLSMVGSLFL